MVALGVGAFVALTGSSSVADVAEPYSLPAAVLRFRQGFGRLIRTTSDRGAVILLDNRVASRWYGRVFLASLPDMERQTGPSRRVLERLAEFYKAT